MSAERFQSIARQTLLRFVLCAGALALLVFLVSDGLTYTEGSVFFSWESLGYLLSTFVLVGGILAFSIGKWMLEGARRVQALQRAVVHFSDQHRVSLEFVRALVEARAARRDEITVVADILERMADNMERHENLRMREEAKQHLWSRVFASSLDAIAISARDRRLLTVNEAFKRITGYSEEEVLGNEMLSSTVSVPNETPLTQIWAAVEMNSYWCGELLDMRKDGTLYPRWLSLSVVRDASQQVTNYIAVL